MIVVVVTNHILRRLDLAFHQIVGNVQQATDKGFVGSNALFLERFAVRAVWQSLGDKTALRTYRHDDRVLDLLSFYETQNLGAVILEPV